MLNLKIRCEDLHEIKRLRTFIKTEINDAYKTYAQSITDYIKTNPSK